MDITRQALQLFSNTYYKDLISAYHAKSISGVEQAANNILYLVGDMGDVLLTNEYFLLGRWLNSAKRMARTPSEAKILEFNARNQITMWGPRENIEDYANKMWNGLVIEYYNIRWKTFINYLLDSLGQGKPFNQTGYDKEILRVETIWNSEQDEYPEHPAGDTLKTVVAIHQKYREKHV